MVTPEIETGTFESAATNSGLDYRGGPSLHESVQNAVILQHVKQVSYKTDRHVHVSLDHIFFRVVEKHSSEEHTASVFTAEE
jgi:hypothetical protein